MIFFEVTESNGTKFTVNTETITFYERYDQAAAREELLQAERLRQRRFGGMDDLDGDPDSLSTELGAELRAAFAAVNELQTKIHFTDGSWRGVRETPEQIQQLTQAALAALLSRGVPPPAPFPGTAFSPPGKPVR